MVNVLSQLAMRVKGEDVFNKFKEVFEQGCKDNANAKPAAPSGEGGAPAAATWTVKKAEGSWKCDTCLTGNPAGTVKCLSCQAPKPGASDADAAVPAPDTQPATPAKPSFAFGLPALAPASGDTLAAAKPAFSFAAPVTGDKKDGGEPPKFAFGLPKPAEEAHKSSGDSGAASPTGEVKAAGADKTESSTPAAKPMFGSAASTPGGGFAALATKGSAGFGAGLFRTEQ
jgi:hypothetical protein